MARRPHSDPTKYLDPRFIPTREDPPPLYEVSMMVPAVVDRLGDSVIKQHEAKPDWSLYRVELRRGNPFIVREMCDRCGKNFVPPSWRKVRGLDVDGIGTIYLETGLCKDCINASVFLDKYLDGEPETFSDSLKLFLKYAEEYERCWRMVLAAAPTVLMTEEEWQHRCNFFNGCAMCGGPIEVRAKYFPAYLNGSYSPWNIIPLCSDCLHKHYAGRVTKGKKIIRYKIFSSQEFFQKSKEIRVYLLNEMDKYNIYREPLQPFRDRFRENKKFGDEFL